MVKIVNSASGRITRLLVQIVPRGDLPVEQLLLEAVFPFKGMVQHPGSPLRFVVLLEQDFDIAPPEGGIMTIDGEPSEANVERENLLQRIDKVVVDFDMKAYQEEAFPSGLFQQGSNLDWHEFYEFVQDPFLVMKGPEDSVVILEPYYAWTRRSPQDCNAGQAKGNMMLSKFLPEVLSANADILVRATPWYFQGGNVLADSGIALIGEDIVRKNLRAYADRFAQNPDPVPAFLEEFRKTIGVEQVICPGLESGGTAWWNQIPCQDARLYHLDLWLTLGGRSKEGRMILFVAQVHVEVAGSWVPGSMNPRDSLPGYLDGVANRLADMLDEAGMPIFQVYRLPLLETMLGVLSYNNSIVEVAGGLRKVYMPVFADYDEQTDIPMNPTSPYIDADSKAIAAYRLAGFEVCKLPRFLNFALNRAGPHCMSLVVQREPQ